MGLSVVVTGATGNLGTSVVRSLSEDDRIERIVGIARRVPDWQLPKVTWSAGDIVRDDLRTVLAGADAVVHLAWLVQPSRDVGHLWDVNAHGSRRLLTAAAQAGVGAVVHLSSVGAYSSGPSSGSPVDESWPTDGIGSSSYSRAKAYVERCLDVIEQEHPETRVVRLRPALIFKRESGDRVRRLFMGALLPPALLTSGRLPVVPAVRGMTFQAVHADDVAGAVLACLLRPVGGAFNLAADPVLGFGDLAELLAARTVTLPAAFVRPLVVASWAARLHPVDVGWFDLARAAPTLDSTRARRELGWDPRWSSDEALAVLVDGIRRRAGGPTAPLDARHAQLGELAEGQGAEEARP